jgi:predicted metal-dependent phosphoesterase TrpH
VRHGYASSIADAFDRYLAKGAPCYVEREHVDPGEILDVAKRSQALVVMAHPLTLGLDAGALDLEVARLVELGLTGLESYYSSYDETIRAELVALARRHGVVPTGGSDYHGTFKPGLSVGSGRGDLSVPDGVLVELRDRLEA